MFSNYNFVCISHLPLVNYVFDLINNNINNNSINLTSNNKKFTVTNVLLYK